MTRRKLFSGLIAGIGLTVTGAVAVPAVFSMFSPVIRRPRTEAWRVIGAVDNFVVGEVRHASVPLQDRDWPRLVPEKGVYVVRESEQTFIVFSRNCTDLSCPIRWDPGSRWFFCPCHGGIFSTEGERMAGPPRRSLYRYASRIRNGVLEIDLRSLPPTT